MSEMSGEILRLIDSRGNVSFVELMGIDGAKGDLEWYFAPNVLIWAGVSQEFVDAMRSLRDKIEPKPTSLLVYFVDGSVIDLPVAKRPTAKGYKNKRWLPLVWNMKA